MKTSLKSLFALAIFGATALVQAQTAPKILVVDMGRVLDGFYQTAEQNEKFKRYQDKAREQDEMMLKEGRALAEQFKEMDEQAKNPTLTADAKAAAQAEAQKKLDEIRKKEQDISNFRGSMQRDLQASFANTRAALVEEVAKVAADIAKKKGATFLIDKTAQSIAQMPIFVYADSTNEISDEVIAELNKNRPAASAPAAAAPAKAGDAPGISFPSTKK